MPSLFHSISLSVAVQTTPNTLTHTCCLPLKSISVLRVCRLHCEIRPRPPHVLGLLWDLVPADPHPPSISGMSQVCLLLALLMLYSCTKVRLLAWLCWIHPQTDCDVPLIHYAFSRVLLTVTDSLEIQSKRELHDEEGCGGIAEMWHEASGSCVSLQVSSTNSLDLVKEQWRSYKNQCLDYINATLPARGEPLSSHHELMSAWSLYAGEWSKPGLQWAPNTDFIDLLFTAGLVCNRTFDLYACWPDGLPGTTVNVSCPWFLPWYRKGLYVSVCVKGGWGGCVYICLSREMNTVAFRLHNHATCTSI